MLNHPESIARAEGALLSGVGQGNWTAASGALQLVELRRIATTLKALLEALTIEDSEGDK